MKIHKERGLSGGVYFVAGPVAIKIGEVKYQIVDSEFRPYKYEDYTKSNKSLSWSKTENLQLSEIDSKMRDKYDIEVTDGILQATMKFFFESWMEAKEQ